MPRRMSVAPVASHTRTPWGAGSSPQHSQHPPQRRRADRLVHPDTHATCQHDFDHTAPRRRCRLGLRPLAGQRGAIGDPNRHQSDGPVPCTRGPRHTSPSADQARANAVSPRHIPHANPRDLGLSDHHRAERKLMPPSAFANNLNPWLPRRLCGCLCGSLFSALDHANIVTASSRLRKAALPGRILCN